MIKTAGLHRFDAAVIRFFACSSDEVFDSVIKVFLRDFFNIAPEPDADLSGKSGKVLLHFQAQSQTTDRISGSGKKLLIKREAGRKLADNNIHRTGTKHGQSLFRLLLLNKEQFNAVFFEPPGDILPGAMIKHKTVDKNYFQSISPNLSYVLQLTILVSNGAYYYHPVLAKPGKFLVFFYFRQVGTE